MKFRVLSTFVSVASFAAALGSSPLWAVPKLTDLYEFPGPGLTEVLGASPLSVGKNVIYGTTGVSIFQLKKVKVTMPGQSPWARTTLAAFGDPSGSRLFGRGGLLLSTSGKIYASLSHGSALGNPFDLVIELTPPAKGQTSWSTNTITSFQDGPDGNYPLEGGLIQDSSGSIFGTAMLGGSTATKYNGCGIVYKLSPPGGGVNGWTKSIIYTFNGVSDGCQPQGALAMDASGAIYGATQFSTENGGTGGTLYKLSPINGGGYSFSKIWTFALNGVDGCTPTGGVTIDPAGNLYGAAATMCQGQKYVPIWKLSPAGSGSYAMTHPWPASDPNPPQVYGAPSLNIKNGTLYGMSYYGDLFKLTPPALGKTVWKKTVLWSLPESESIHSPVFSAGALYFGISGLPSRFGTIYKSSP